MAWSRRPPASAALLLLSCLLCRGVSPQRPRVSVNEISGFSLSPPYFNLAEGSAISATATCGEDQRSRPRSDLYCKLVGGPAIGVPSQTIQGQFCDHCNANDPDKAHPVTNAIDGTERWWQSPPLSRGLNYNEVNVTLDLGQLFHVAYVIVKFANSPRPDLWVLERSVDHGRTFMPWQYFAHSKRDCIERFGKQPNGRIHRDDDQICMTEYSRIVPLENGEIVVSLVNGRPGSKNFTYAPVLQDFTKATNIRLRFLRTNTLLGHLISKAQRDPTVTRRYYYSIKDISVGGRCVCHGHAQVCGARVPGMNQLLCECEHNTCGESCDRCCPGFHQKPWRPATANSPNECEACQCHSHATDCYYDPEVERRKASLNIYGRYDGGGVCVNCQHNTAGVNCEVCAVGFYRPHGIPRESPTGCIPCRCDSRTTVGCEMGSGRCLCKPQYSGDNCERCARGYYGYPRCIPYPVPITTTQSPAGSIVDPNCPVGYFGAPRCRECDCERRGTVPEVCSASGHCLCRPEVTGGRCDRCQPGYHYFPYCQECRCDGPGVADRSCGPNGQCRCLPNFAGLQCEQCARGYYAYPTCRPCQCSREGSREEACDPNTGHCVCRPGVTGQRCDRCILGDQRFPYCSACRCEGPGVADQSCGPKGQCRCQFNFAGMQCEECARGYYAYPTCRPCQCSREGSREEMCDQQTGRCVCRPGVTGQRCDHCTAKGQNFPYCFECRCDGPGVADRSCGPEGQCRCHSNFAGMRCEQCARGSYAYPTCRPCQCSREGSREETCDQQTGQCVCRSGVTGQKCDRCVSGDQRFPYCFECRCDGPGVADRSCGPKGQCRCRSNFAGLQCEQCAAGYYAYPSCRSCQCSREGSREMTCDPRTGQCVCRPGVSGQRCDRCIAESQSFPYCFECRCDGPGVADQSCGPNGQCRCRFNFAGPQCEQCARGSYAYPTCRPCQCSREGSREETCDQQIGQCVCRPGVTGLKCDRCIARDQRFPNCFECRCDGPGVADRSCGPDGQCRCRSNFAGPQCEQCATGYYAYPTCRSCQCSREGSLGEMCDPQTGQCVCRSGVTGQRCDRCISGDQRFPYCFACRCDGPGVADQSCGPKRQCRCRTNFAGMQCEQCATGYYGYPACRPCQCSREGSREETCDLATGQCVCRSGVTGQRCDRCIEGDQIFPYCVAPSNHCNSAGSEVSVKDPITDSCICLPYVEGEECEHCKPLFWNLDQENPSGCVECMCEVRGTQSGVGECEEGNGDCFCKPNVCSRTCSTCKDGYFLLQKKNYFGCQGCQCDVGGAVASSCEESTGQCRCRKRMRGRTCSEPETNFYLPTLHHLKFEVENGITPNARQVRFGYDPREFPQFSWRGYAVLTPAQPEVVLYLVVGSPGPFNIVVRYATAGLQRAVRGRLLLVAGVGFYSHCNWSGESKEVLFPPSRSPAFLTVPGDGFAQPFTLNPGKWIVCIKAEGVLLDYLVILPSAFYEAPILQHPITEPCTYLASAERGNCLLYKHVPMDSFPSAQASQGLRQLTADHPQLASVSGRQAQLRLMLHVPESGSHVLVLEYASEMNNTQNVNVFIGGQPLDQVQTRANIYSCAYSFLCRSIVVDGENRAAHFLLPPKAEILLQASAASFLLNRVYAVPSDNFTMELINPKELCVSVHGRFTDDSKHCVQSQFHTPSTAVVLDASSVTRPVRFTSQSSGRCNGLLLKYPQTEVELSAQVPQPGRYVFIVQYCQPEHPAFPVEVLLNTGSTWAGQLNASFCPTMSGCRGAVIAERRISLDAMQQTMIITLRIPKGKTLTLDYILAVPEDRYSPELLKAKALDKASDFISQCGSQGFYINPRSASEFCKASARSLVAHYYKGALPCDCDKVGSTSPTCKPFGGQCSCRAHVIGRQCTRCATGFYGFPYCRPCDCGQRLCDEVTGECICPPQTVRPACEVCESRTFSYHPLLGCEGCDCSPIGVSPGDTGQCHITTGQCTCKPRIGGRQCSQCVSGYYRFPECIHCSCNVGGVIPQICDPNSGQCLCKSNVEGSRCDTCRKGSFHFDPANPEGCTKCFCFGATDQCRSSEKRRGKFVDMRSWRLMSSDLEEIPTVLNPLSNTVVADVQELPVSVVQVHWVLPQSYLGDRVSSYGGYLTYQIKSFGIPREGMRLLDKQPDVLLKGQKMTLVYQDPQPPSPDRLYQGRVQLVESNFRHSGTNRPVSREEFMHVLSRLEAVWIRALHFSQSQRLSIGDVGMEEASLTGSGGPASTVEVCSCPPQYTGDSCQRCARGFYRDRSSRCVPCACNGLSDECEESTGKCRNCQDNTAGDHCERCKDGYYGSAALRTCKICPCPLQLESNNFAVGCSEVAGRVQCLCKTGYTGERCERCASGYYDDPEFLEDRCRPCNCNGNSCSPKTGACNNGQDPKDTNTDEQCQECDNCAQTLLNDLDRLEDELSQIKAQLDSLNSSSSAYDRLKKLEAAIADTKNVVTDYSAAVDRLSPKVAELEKDALSVSEDIKLLLFKAQKRSNDAQTAAANIEKTHQRAKDLESQTLDLLRKILELLQQLKDAERGNGTVPSGDVATLMAEAERMVKEMQERSLKPQKDAAVKELDEAQKLLEYVKNNCTKQYDQNQEAAKRIKGLLSDYEAKLKELEEALKQASDTVMQANDQNSLNNKTLNDLLEKIKKLEKERDRVFADIVLAKRQLNDTENLLKMLSDSKKEYEQLAAQLDGAKKDLINKVNSISQAAAKEGLVKEAEDHAATLSRLANDLQEAVRNSSGRTDVQDALAAIDAYKNITDAIKAAEEAAKRAKDAADKALNDVVQGDVTNRAKDLKDEGNRLLKDATNAAKDLKQATDDLTNQQQRLDDAEKKKNALEKELAAINTDLKGVQRDDIGKMIDAAKKTAEAANTSATDTLDQLKAINKEVAKINATPSGSNIDRMLNDVDMTVKNLSSSIPSLLDKIAQVERLSSQIDPNNNISNNINRIKDLIDQARAAANRIAVPMKFIGDGYVELRPPKDLDDLRAYAALSLLLQRPNYNARGDGRRRRRQTNTDNGNLFVLYLGNKDSSKDYLGMALRNNVLYVIYKLNGRSYELETDSITLSGKEPFYFDRVDMHRIYEDVQIKLTKVFTSTNPPNPLIYTRRGEPLLNLLNLDPNEVVFYVGGYPDNFTLPPSLNYPKYRGCIEFSTLNEKFISLYNFKSLTPQNISDREPCKRYVIPRNDYFEGSGYAKVELVNMQSTLMISQWMESKADSAVLLYFTNEASFYCLTIEKGRMVMRGRDGDTILKEEISVGRFDLNGELKVIFQSSDKKIRVRMKSVEVLVFPYTLKKFDSYYIGGIPKDLRERDNITVLPLKGCVHSLSAAGTNPKVLERVGVGRGCYPELLTARKAEFNVGGSLETAPTGFDLSKDMVLSVGFRSTEKNGLLLQNKQDVNELELDMVDGHVMLTFQNNVWKSKKQYQDGEWHYLSVVKTGQNIEFRVDEDDDGEKNTVSPPALTFISNDIVLGKGTFTGCLSNLYMRRPDFDFKAEDLSTFSPYGDVLLDVCSAARPPENMLAGRNQTLNQDGREDAKGDEGSNCFTPTPIPHSFHLAGASSSLSYAVASTTLTNMPYFSLDIKTRSAEGLLFYIPAEQDNYHVALYVSKGRIRFSIGSQREILNRDKYNDGKWHTVTLSLEKRKFRLVIDGLRAKDGELNPREGSSIQLSSAIYLGTPPPSTHKVLKGKRLPEHGVIGCIRSFKMNGSLMAAAAVNRGVGPCFEGQTESGAYFSGHGAYVIVDESFVVGQSFELVFELRPSKQSALLLHVGNQNHLTVFMRREEVVAQVNSGGGEFSVVVQPKQSLCDGVFHRIAVIQRNNVVEMHVDTEGNYTIGPSFSSPTQDTHPVYVGGVPDHLKFSLPVTESYVGCLQNLVINRNVVVFEKLSGVFGAVNLRECPVNLRPPQHSPSAKSPVRRP
ncbi:laminin subunit alpha-3-like isoform X2 [Pygocentrus nattereri]|uniref:laminin subunit alpha-3-like isoform X2 n=1 Tax=Pygocentrus nattereri TaxID=42514 RepID=UPI001890C4BF|nr:laminin subunit alpha-3-like isoform X2 [Pygocentrus nattereri]